MAHLFVRAIDAVLNPVQRRFNTVKRNLRRLTDYVTAHPADSAAAAGVGALTMAAIWGGSALVGAAVTGLLAHRKPGAALR